MRFNRSNQCAVLVATASSHLLAIPTAAIIGISSLPRTPPPPAAAPWLAGFVWLARPALLLAPFGHAPEADATGAVVALAPADAPLPLAIAIEAVGGLATAHPLPPAGRLSAASPAAWLSPCRLADGRDAALLDPDAIAAVARAAA